MAELVTHAKHKAFASKHLDTLWKLAATSESRGWSIAGSNPVGTIMSENEAIDLLEDLAEGIGPITRIRYIRCTCQPGQWPCECDKTLFTLVEDRSGQEKEEEEENC